MQIVANLYIVLRCNPTKPASRSGCWNQAVKAKELLFQETCRLYSSDLLRLVKNW